MLILILGIVVFLGAHTLTTMRDRRAALIERFGAGPYKVSHSVASLIGLVLIVWGFSRYRAEDWVQVWTPPEGMRHLTIALMWFAFVALACMGPSPGRIRGWAVFDRIAVKRRGDFGAARIASFTRADAVALGAGTVAYLAMIFLHPYLIGVPVIG
jgi:hypothetical protein